MNTQTYLFDNKESIPNGLYVDLMNKLKLDFETAPKKKVPHYLPMNKTDILLAIGQHSINWANRDVVLAQVAKKDLRHLKSFCKSNGIDTKKVNPEWTE